MAAEKQTRKELLEEPDPVTVTLHRIAGFFVTYWKPVVSGVVAVLVVVAAISGYFYFQNRTENAAATLFTKAMDQYSTVLSRNGSAEEYREVKRDFEYILENYGKTKVAQMALVQYAGACYRSGELEEAVAHYEKALSRMPKSHKFREMAVIGLAYAYEGLNDHGNAIKHFEAIAADPEAATRDQALFKLGQLYADAGEPEKSREAFAKIVATHTDSIYFELAKARIGG